MTFLGFQIGPLTSVTGAWSVSANLEAGPQVAEQAKLWTALPRRPRPHLVRNIDGYAVEVHEGTGPFKPPHLRVIQGGKS